MPPDLLEISGALFAGLGLFFIGVKLIGGHLKRMAGPSLRKWVAKAVNRRWQGAVLGVVSGAVTQSTNAVTFIVTSMNAAGLVSVERAMPIVIWANLGTAALVLIATVDIHLTVLYLLGLVGLAYYFDVDKSDRFRHPAGALLGVVLLFQGLLLIKAGALPLREMDSVRELLGLAARSYLLSFCVGAAITMVVQSSATVSVIAVAMTVVGLLSMNQTIMIIYGASIGSAASLWFMSSNLQGTGRQLVLLQILLKGIATLLLLILFALEQFFGVPLVQALVTGMTSDIGTQAALVYLIVQLVGGISMTLGSKPVLKLLGHWSPPSLRETLAQPRYLYDQALDDAASAVDLVEKEQERLIGMLPAYLSAAEMAENAEEQGPGSELYQANQAVGDKIAEFITELMNRNADGQMLDRLLNLQTRNRFLNDLRAGLHEFDRLILLANKKLRDTPDQNGDNSLVTGLTESMHFILLTLKDATTSGETEDVAMLKMLTSDRSDLMERLRVKLLREGSHLHHQAHEALFAATSLFERLVWIVGQYGQLLERNAQTGMRPAAA